MKSRHVRAAAASLFGLGLWTLLVGCPPTNYPPPPDPDGGSPPPPDAPISDAPIQDAPQQEAGPVTCTSFDDTRSLAITDEVILQDATAPTDPNKSPFSLQRVLAQLLSQPQPASTQTPKELFQQWWETQLPAASATPRSSPIHCDDERVVGPGDGGAPGFNGFRWMCPRNEGALSKVDPFASASPNAFRPIGLFNRFDLASDDGSDCGEYRIIYGHTQGGQRNLVIFEARLANPRPACGKDACRPVVDFWRNLSCNTNATDMQKKLADFYFKGLPGFAPVIHVNHFAPATGQIRTNQFMATGATGAQAPQLWMLREYKLAVDCSTPPCETVFIPTTTKSNPSPTLFGENAANATFKAEFLQRLPTLLATGIDDFFLDEIVTADSGQSMEQGGGADAPANEYFGASSAQFRAQVQARIAALNVPNVSAEQVLRRASAMSCGGCHQFSNGNNLGFSQPWPSSLGFVHVSEQQKLPSTWAPGTQRFAISPALTNNFLPHRRKVMTEFLAGARLCAPTLAPQIAGVLPVTRVPPKPGAPRIRIKAVEIRDIDRASLTVKKNTVGGKRFVH